MDPFVTRTFYDALRSPEVDPRWTDEDHGAERVQLLVWALLRSRPDRYNGGFVVDQKGGRFVRGWDPDSDRQDVGLRALLQGLADGLPQDGGLFNVDGYSRQTAQRGRTGPGRATAISELALPQSVYDAREYELEHGADDPLVHAVTGRQYVPGRDRPEAVRKALARASDHSPSDTPAETTELIDYLHGRRIDNYTRRLSAVLPALTQHARRIEDRDVRHAHIDTLRRLRLQPLPGYKTTERTQRLSPHGTSFAGAPKWIRRAVFADCVEIDMASAQLALVAALWDVPSVRAFLESGDSIWDELSRWLAGGFSRAQFDHDRDGPRLKGILKKQIYSICFGRSVDNIVQWGSPYVRGLKEKARRDATVTAVRGMFYHRPSAVGRRLIGHPLLANLLGARERRSSDIERDGGLADVFGRQYVLGEQRGGKRVETRNALAAEAQAAEHFVMLRVARMFMDAAKAAGDDTPQAQILLWQSDGLTFKVRQKDRWRHWVERAEAGLQRGCRELEGLTGCPTVHTKLTVDHEPD